MRLSRLRQLIPAFTISLLAMFLCNCASQPKKVIDYSHIEQAFEELERETALKKSEKQTKILEKRPEWAEEEDKNYITSTEWSVQGGNKQYQELVKSLKKRVLANLSEEVKVTVREVFIDIVQEKDGFLEEYAESVIKTNSSATFFKDELDLVVYPSEIGVGEGDTVWVYGRLNYLVYKSRLEDERRDFEHQAVETFQEAVRALESGNMYQCLDKLIRSKYYVDRGGGSKSFPHFLDQTLGDRRVVDQLHDLHSELIKQLRIRTVTQNQNDRVTFVREDPVKYLKIQLYSPITSRYDFSGIVIEAKAVDSGKLIQATTVTNEQGITGFDLRDALKDREELNLVISPRLKPLGIDDEIWFSSFSHQDFKSKLFPLTITVNHQAFPQRNILTVVTKESDVLVSNSTMNSLNDALDQEVFNYTQFFNLLKQEAGMGTQELARVVSSRKKLSSEQLDKLSTVDAIIHISIESASKYIVRMKLLNVVDNSLNVLAMSSINISNDIELRSEGMKRIFRLFMDEFFLRTVKLNFNEKVNYSVVINGDPYDPSKQEKSAVCKDLSRYHTQNIEVNSGNYRTYRTTVKPDVFSFKTSNPRRNQSSTQYIIFKDIQLVRKSGTLTVNVTNDDGGNLRGYQTSIKLWQPRMFFFRANKVSHKGVSTREFALTNLGLYQVSAAYPGYSKPLPKFINIRDDLAVQGRQMVHFPLVEKSAFKAIVLSSAYPGWGHLYLDKPWWQMLLPAAFYTMALAVSGTAYYDYTSYRDEFKGYQDSYFNAATEDDLDRYKNLADKSWTNMHRAKSRFEYGVSSAILSNLMTSTILYIQKKID